MALVDISSWHQDWKAETGMTLDEFSAAAKLQYMIDFGKAGLARNASEYDRANALDDRLVSDVKAGLQRKSAPRAAAEEKLATPAQVDFIMALIAKGAHEEGGYIDGPVTRAGVAAMSSRAASAYIYSLRGE